MFFKFHTLMALIVMLYFDALTHIIKILLITTVIQSQDLHDKTARGLLKSFHVTTANIPNQLRIQYHQHLIDQTESIQKDSQILSPAAHPYME